MLKRFVRLLNDYPRLSLFLTAFLARAALSIIIGPQADADPPLLEMARNVIAGKGPIWFEQGITVYAWLPPMFSYVMAPYMMVFGENLEPLRWILIIWSSWACVQVAQLGEHSMGKRGQLAGWIWALYPTQIFWSSRANPFTIGTNLVVALVWLALKFAPKREGKAGFLVPAFIGLAWAFLSLMRSEYFLMFAPLALFFLMTDRFNLKRTAIASLFFLIGMSPWIIRNYKIFNSFVPLTTNSGLIFWFTFNDTYQFTGDMRSLPPELAPAPRGENEVQMGKRISGIAVQYIKDNPGRALYIWVGNLLHFWRPYLSSNARDVSPARNVIYVLTWVPIFIFFLLGLRHYPLKDPFWTLILTLVLIKWFSHSFFYMIVHFREMIAPLLILIATRGFVQQTNEDPA